ncbi:MAG: STAS domain-containing protein [Alphaproteobacteria bacterium]|nr:STAS domain-containing protein [Alphaproteobacteria bacterium]
MEFTVSDKEDEAEVKITGRLTFAEHEQCRRIMAELGESSGNRQVVDLREVEFIDSAGLGLLLLLRENAEKQSRSVVLRVPAEGQVRRMLDIARFQDLIPIEN